MAKLFYQVIEENFSAKISNWQHSRYCGKILHNTDIESLIYSIYEISVVVSLSVVVPKEDEQEC